MDDITASIIVTCQTAGAVTSINKLGFAFGMLAKKLVEWGFASVKSFSDLEEETQKFNVVFAGMGDRSAQITKDLVANYGQSELSAKKMLAATGDLLSGFGLARDEALTLAEGAAKLGADLASFTNYAGGAEGATQALTKAMLGERESLKLLGVAIREDDDRYKELTKQAMTTGVEIPGMNKRIRATTVQQAKAVASLALSYEQSKNAIGDFKRNSDSLANQSRVLTNNILDLQTSVGGLIAKSLEISSAQANVSAGLQEITEYIKRNTKKWAYNVATFINNARGGFEVLYVGAVDVFANIAIVCQYVTDLVFQSWSDAPGFFGAIWKDISDSATTAWEVIKKTFVANYRLQGDVLLAFWSLNKDGFIGIMDAGKRTFLSLAGIVKDWVLGVFKLLTHLGESFWDVLIGKKTFAQATKGLTKEFERSLEEIKDNAQAKWEGFDFSFGWNKFTESFGEAADKYAGSMKEIARESANILTSTNTSEYLAKKGIVLGEFFDPMKSINEALDKAKSRQDEIDRRFNQADKKQEAGKESSSQGTFADSISKVVTDLAKNISKYQQTTQKAITSQSLEGTALQSRIFTNTSVSLDTPAQQTADGVKKMVAKLGKLENEIQRLRSALTSNGVKVTGIAGHVY